MSELVGVAEEHPNFISASRRAKELAAQFQECVGIERTPTGWAVLTSSSVLVTLVRNELEKEKSLEYERYEIDSYEENGRRDVEQERIAEMLDYQDSLERSEETGWFYDD